MLTSTERRYEITCYLSTALFVGLIFGCMVILVFFTGTALDDLERLEVKLAQKMLGVYWMIVLCISGLLGILALSALYIAILLLLTGNEKK